MEFARSSGLPATGSSVAVYTPTPPTYFFQVMSLLHARLASESVEGGVGWEHASYMCGTRGVLANKGCSFRIQYRISKGQWLRPSYVPFRLRTIHHIAVIRKGHCSVDSALTSVTFLSNNITNYVLDVNEIIN
jgi:hypothetical protein